jgi:hypothetical protein
MAIIGADSMMVGKAVLTLVDAMMSTMVGDAVSMSMADDAMSMSMVVGDAELTAITGDELSILVDAGRSVDPDPIVPIVGAN